MEMKITTTCPNCSKDLVITGIKLFFDNPQKQEVHTAVASDNSKTNGYVGWKGEAKKEVLETSPDNTIRVDNSAPDADVNKLLKEAVETINPKPSNGDNYKPFTKSQEEDPNPNNLKVEPSVKTPTEPIKQKKEEEELVPLLRKELIPLLAEKISPDLYILSEALIKQAEESRKKGLCLLCNKNPSNPNNSICESCLGKYIVDNTKQEQPEPKVKTAW